MNKESGVMNRRSFVQAAGTTMTGAVAYLGGATALADKAAEQKLAGTAQNGEMTSNLSAGHTVCLPVTAEYDVVVAGGGLAGVSAACAAALAGAKTAMIEAQAFAGGVATATMEATMCRHFYAKDGTLVVGGCPLDLVKRMVKLGATTPNWADHKFHVTFDVELAKLAMDRMLDDAGVDVYYSSIVTDAVVRDGCVRGVVVSNRSGNQVFTAGCVVDATGDADVCHYAGVPLRAGRMSNSFMFRLGNVDFDRLVAFFRENPREYGVGRSIENMLKFYEDGYFILEHYGDKLEKTVQKAIEEGRYSKNWGPFHDMHAFKMSGIRAYKTLKINTGQVVIAEPDGKGLSDLMRKGREMSHYVAEFLRKNLPGCEDSFVVHTSTMLGLRRTRWLEAPFTLTKDSYGKPFEDAVGRGVASARWCKDSPTFDVPLRCMLPPKMDGLIVGSGRSVSSDPAELLRVQSVTMIVGQGAGVAAALAARDKVPVRNVDIQRLQKVLRDEGVKL